VRLKNQNKPSAYYEVEFYHGQVEYEYRLDAFNGMILKVEIDYKKAVTK